LRIGIIASLAALAACEQSRSVTAPASRRDAPGDALASKQGTTSSEMLITVAATDNVGSDVARMNDDGTNLVMLASGGSVHANPAWAPDGKRIVFASDLFGTQPYQASLYAMNADGTDLTRLTFALANGTDIDPVGFAAGVVFARGNGSGVEVSLLGADGGVTQLTSGPSDVQPAPSPKGKSVAFRRGDEIYVLDLVTLGVTNLTNTPGCVESSPAYSPSGKQIAFTRNSCGTVAGGIFVMNDDGTEVTRLTTSNNSLDFGPKWSPDGKRIGFSRASPGLVSMYQTSIYVMNADGTAVTQIVPPDLTLNYTLSAWARY
jgi:Tol biopolymer transport system component